MKVKIIKPISKLFRVGEIVEMEISNTQGGFVLSTDKVSQSFGSDYHARVKPVTFEEFAGVLATKIENEIIQENENS